MKRVNYHDVPEHGLQIEETVQAGDRAGAQSLARYWWAWDMISNRNRKYGNTEISTIKTVWDLGCGCGYGCRIMSEQNDVDVIGFETDKRALNVAFEEFPSPRLRFVEFFLENHWQHPAFTVKPDLVTCFGVLHLIRHRDFFMEQLAENLKPNSVCLFSAAHAGRTLCHSAPPREDAAFFHYNTQILRRFLGRYFKTVVIPDNDKGMPPLFDKTNQWIAENRKPEERFTVGDDCIFCADPIR